MEFFVQLQTLAMLEVMALLCFYFMFLCDTSVLLIHNNYILELSSILFQTDEVSGSKKVKQKIRKRYRDQKK